MTEGPLAPLAGAIPPAPAWFAQAIANAPESNSVEVEGARIHYLRWGDRARPGVLLVHGYSAHAHWWSFVAPFLAGDYNVAAMDLSGMGDSDWRSVYAMELFAREQFAVCEDAGMFAAHRPPVIIGHSFGGLVAILAGALHGERLAGMIVVDASVNPPSRILPPREQRPHKIYPTEAEALARYWLLPPQPCDNLYLLDWVARHSLKQVEGGYRWKFDPGLSQSLTMGDTASRLKAIKCRIAVCRGENSARLPTEVGEQMFELLGRAAPVIAIPQAQHHVMLDQPLALAAVLRALLADWEHSTPRRPAGS